MLKILQYNENDSFVFELQQKIKQLKEIAIIQKNIHDVHEN